MIPYLILLTIIPTAACALKPQSNRRNKRIYVFFISVCFFILAAFRAVTIGVDTRQFAGAYQSIASDGTLDFDKYRYEHGFVVLCFLLSRLTSNYQLLLIVVALFLTIGTGLFFYYFSKDVSMSFFLFVTLNVFFSYLNTMRQALASVFVIIAFYFFEKDRKILALVLALLAPMFHQTAWLFVLMFPIMLRRFTKRTFLGYAACTVLLFCLSGQVTQFIAFVMGKDEFYDPNHSESNYYGALIIFLFYTVIALTCLYLIRKKLKQGGDPNAAFFAHALMMWVLFSALGVKVEVLSRFGGYYALFVVALIPSALGLKDKRVQMIVEYGLCVVSLLYFMIICMCKPEWYGTVPYVFDFANTQQMFHSLMSVGV